ncbi:hypothetical protein [Streptomyces sviceus]|uniref:hypothetical protein n=1 Tax=Streptomyces sviceus TaxID=285530 RepID=UPI0036EEBCE8
MLKTTTISNHHHQRPPGPHPVVRRSAGRPDARPDRAAHPGIAEQFRQHPGVKAKVVDGLSRLR